MGKLNGTLPIEGTVGNITFAKTKNGVVVKGKSSVDASKIAKDPKYERTRENNREFARASTAGRALRHVFSRALFVEPDGGWVNRLSGRMLRVIQSDNEGKRGSRTIQPEHLHLLQGYELNQASRLADCLFLYPELTYDVAAGKLSAAFADFHPDCVINAPDKTTHFRVTLCGILFDTSKHQSEAFQESTEMMPFHHNPVTGLNIEIAVPPAKGRPLIVALGMEFYKLIRNIHSPLEDGQKNAAAVMKVWNNLSAT